MSTSLKSLISMAIGILLVIISNNVWHAQPPFALLATPFLLPFIVVAVFYPIFKQSHLLAVVCGCALILFNDLLMRVSSGPYDSEGGAIVVVVSMAALIISLISMIIYARQAKDGKAFQKSFIAVIISALAWAVYMTFFLGIGMRK